MTVRIRGSVRLGWLGASLLVVACGGASPGSNEHDNQNGNTNTNTNTNECSWEDMCFVDFPCGVSSACVTDASDLMIHNVTYPCEDVCGPCCSGAGCTPGTRSCAAGEVCAYPDADPTLFSPETRMHYGADAPSCVPLAQVCGGAEGLPCPAGQFCELVGLLCPAGDPWVGGCIGVTDRDTDFCAYGEAGGYGTCRSIPEPAACVGLDAEPVCSCDGSTYENDCLRRAAGVPLRHPGACAIDP